MPADALATLGASASAGMVLTPEAGILCLQHQKSSKLVNPWHLATKAFLFIFIFYQNAYSATCSKVHFVGRVELQNTAFFTYASEKITMINK